MSARLQQMLQLNPEFAQAYEKGEPWAQQRADEILGLDGQASRRHPERNRLQDGTPRNWCGTCLHEEGCVACDLDGDHEVTKMLRRSSRTESQ